MTLPRAPAPGERWPKRHRQTDNSGTTVTPSILAGYILARVGRLPAAPAGQGCPYEHGGAPVSSKLDNMRTIAPTSARHGGLGR